MMNRNFFVRLAFAAHRVADALPQEEQIVKEIRETVNEILVDLILLMDKEVTRAEKKHDLLFGLERQIDILLVYLDRAKKEGWVNPENFSLLEAEYGKIRELLEIFEDVGEPIAQKGEEEVKKEKPKLQEQSVLTERQRRIVEFLRTKENAQVWELQKVLPQVTKRTLRRDLDELLEKNLVARKGEWNAVSYGLK